MSDVPEPGALALLEALRGVLAELAEPDQVLRTLLTQAVRLTEAERGVFVEVRDGGGLDYRVLHRFQKDEFDGASGEFSRSIFGEVLKRGEPVLLENALKTPGVGSSLSVQQMKLVSILCVPVRASGRVLGLVHVEHGRAGHLTAAHRDVLVSLATLAGPVLETLRSARTALEERDRLREAERRARRELEESRGLLARDWSFGRFVGRSPAVRALEEEIRKAARSEAPVLITGETGTGKGLLARILHHAGPRAGRPFVTLFGPNLERGLVESELFGHKRGAFTGADQDRPGKIEAAAGGSLLLDEVADIPIELQPKILRLLQERTYERLGETQERRADVRILAATNRDLPAEIAAGRFRRDLYERLNFLPIDVPPLRERKSDIPLLLRHALDAIDAGRWIEIAPEAERWLAGLEFLWPGNVRHVEQLAARLALESFDHPVGIAGLAARLGTATAAAASPDLDLDDGLPALLERTEREWLARAIAGNPELTRRELAAKLKISEPTLYKKLKQHGLGGGS